MRNGPRVNGGVPYWAKSSLAHAASGRAAHMPASEAEARLAHDIAELMHRREPPRAVPRRAGLTAALDNLDRNAFADAERNAGAERLAPASVPPPIPAAAPNPAYVMPGLVSVPDRPRVEPRPGTWIKKARRRRRMSAIKAAGAWMTSLAIVGLVVATAAVILGAPRDLSSLTQLAAFLLRH